MKKKSYNPFKMWGSYVGFIIAFGLYGLVRTMKYKFFENPFFIPIDSSAIFGMTYPIWGVLGFLIGWGIHSLIRKLK